MTGDTTVRRSTIEECACGEVIIGGDCPECADVLEELGSTQATIYRELQKGDALAAELVERTDLSYRSVTSGLSRLFDSDYVDRFRYSQDPVKRVYTIDLGEGSR